MKEAFKRLVMRERFVHFVLVMGLTPSIVQLFRHGKLSPLEAFTVGLNGGSLIYSEILVQTRRWTDYWRDQAFKYLEEKITVSHYTAESINKPGFSEHKEN